LEVNRRFFLYSAFVHSELFIKTDPREVHTGFWWGDLREGDHLGEPGIDGRII
jgi:hypothetical protein